MVSYVFHTRLGEVFVYPIPCMQHLPHPFSTSTTIQLLYRLSRMPYIRKLNSNSRTICCPSVFTGHGDRVFSPSVFHSQPFRNNKQGYVKRYVGTCKAINYVIKKPCVACGWLKMLDLILPILPRNNYSVLRNM